MNGNIIKNKYHMVIILYYGFIVNIIMIASYALLISTIKHLQIENYKIKYKSIVFLIFIG